MNKTRLISIFAVVMVLLNAYLLFDLKKEDGPRGPHKPGKSIIKDLNFDEEQMKQFRALVDDHKRESRKIRDALKSNRDRYFGSLRDNGELPDDQKDRMNSEMMELHRQLNELNYEHLKDIRGICREDQLNKFDNLIEKLGGRLSGHPPPRRRRPPRPH